MPGLVCNGFKVILAEDYTDPVTGLLDTNRIALDVFDDKGQHYILPEITVLPNQVDLICLLLRRIANAKAQTGWKFEGTYTAPGPGIITG